MTDRLTAQMAFLHEADKLKNVNRATLVRDSLRRENSAEHSWHLALYALVLSEHAPDGIDPHRVIKMALLHDLVEIDAGDTPVFGDFDATAQAASEQAAADRLFGLLPADQAADLRALWDEFEANQTLDARFAKSLDRFVAPNQNMLTGGGSWVEYNVTFDAFAERIGKKVDAGAPRLWSWLKPRAQAFFATLRP
ncbi:HD domain-containing protein [Mesobacterium sp. TK19101]|uniref:HD domain-containing protein n=1 Tax=Mesobacterium hydrothermale TaxID=3111907 RepID=A0ABU6HKM1_9RHOB|nr:HD domain-containing protein [Mesobacterium sp. TK19101]MEC3862984.1 HD domain-containing protein [Mesobacterium sp. TK19101]